MLGLLVQNQSHRAGTHLRAKLIRRIPHQTFFSGEMVSANPGAVHLHREWFLRSALADLLGEDAGLAEIHKLYRCHDRLLIYKQAVFDHLAARWRDLFNISCDVLLYDLTSTYF